MCTHPECQRDTKNGVTLPCRYPDAPTWTFRQLQRTYGPGLVCIRDRKTAADMLASKTSCCWGAGQTIGESGWITLASPSPTYLAPKRVTFVCRASLVAKRQAMKDTVRHE